MATTATGGRFPCPTRWRDPPVEPPLRVPRLGEDGWRLPLAPPGQRRPQARGVSVMPRGLDQDPPDVGVARLRDAPAPFPIPRGGLARDQPDVRHELAGMREPLEVPHLDQERQRGERVEASEAAEPAHRGPVGRLLGNGLELLRQVGPPGEELRPGEAILLTRPPEHRVGKALAPEPGPVPLGPVAALAVDPTVAGEELQEPVPPAEQILLHIFAAAEQIPDRLLRFIGDADGGEVPRAEGAHELGRIPAVGLDPVSGLPGGQGRGHDLAGNAEGRELAVQVVSRGARLVAGHDGALALQPIKEAPEVPGLIGDGAQFGHLGLRPQEPRHERVLAVIEGHVRGILSHDRPPFACGSVPSLEQPTLFCDRSGRSFHIV